MAPQAQIQSDVQLLKSYAWAGRRFAQALNERKPITGALLRTNDTLQKDEWVAFNEVVIQEAAIRLQGIADLLATPGLNTPLPNALGKTVIEQQKMSDPGPASVTLSGVDRTTRDRGEFTSFFVPNPIVHKDFSFLLRELIASRTRGEPLDVSHARVAARLVTEKLEEILFQGGPAFGGNTVHGYTTHPDRNTAVFGVNGAWDATAKTGENILADLITLLKAAEADRFFGPYWLYVPGDAGAKLAEDFKANSDKTIMQRLREVPQIAAIRVVDQLLSANVVLVQATSDVVELRVGESIQTGQWDEPGGWEVNIKVWALMTPVVKSDAQGRSGIIHMS